MENMERVSKHFKLPRIIVDKIEDMSRRKGLNQTAIVIMAINELDRKNGDEPKEPETAP